jgi:dihydrofolate synthase/folylpolyglutamate synthase
MPYSDIQALAARHELAGNAYPTVAEAYCKAREDAAENDFIYVGGSSFVVADLLSSFRNGQDNS